VLERRRGRVTKPEPANHDVERGRQPLECEARERNFSLVEEARHQECVAELDLVDLAAVKRQHPAAAQDELAQRSAAVVQLLETGVHAHRRRPYSITIRS
jgi:hypothetical protein